MDISELYRLFLHYPHVTTDSRNCPNDSLFFALKGERFDGNAFAKQALDNGARYAVIDNPAYATGERTLLVNDVLTALQCLALRHRAILSVPVIAITGTNGKTTTKELLADVLSTRFHLLATEGNLNNAIGVPLTLLRLTREHQLAVIEMGASQPGDIRKLTEIALPNYGLITNIGRAHLEGFGSLKQVAKTKGELFDSLRRTKGVVFLRKGDRRLTALAKGIEQVTYGDTRGAFISGRILSADPFLSFEWMHRRHTHIVETQLIGDYNFYNALAAVTVGLYFRIPPLHICRAIAEYCPTNNRSQLMRTERNTLIIDAYNANPDSMRAALRNFAALTARPKAVILGDMKELGANSLALHSEVLDEVAAAAFDHVFLCGEQFMQAAHGRFPAWPSPNALRDALQHNPPSGYHILLKASRAGALEQLIPCL